MKIFFVESNFDKTVGGSHACMYNLIRHMDRSEYDFTVGFYVDNIYVKKYHDLGIETKILPRNPVRTGNIMLRKICNWYRLEYSFIKYLENYFRSKRFDLVVQNNSIKLSLPFVRACKGLNIPVLAYERGISLYSKKFVKATGAIQASIAISDAVKQNLMSYKFRSPIIERIYDGIDPLGFAVKRSPDEIKRDLNISPKSRIIGMIGNIKPWKGQQYFVDAFLELAKQYNDLYGLVIGGCAEEDREFQASLSQTVSKAGLANRLMFLGFRTDVPDLLSIFDVFVHASRRAEPFGMVVLEAMAARKPIIATNMGGPVEILNKGKCGILVPPKDGKAIADACTKYLDDPDFKEEMIDRAYKRVVENFHINQTAERKDRLFKRIYDSRK